jgi:Na+-translocating ferredoxin:NAD+ oxidoreductase RnfG subunit
MNQGSKATLRQKAIRFVIVLTAVSLTSGVALSGLYKASRTAIRANQAKSFESKLLEVLGDARNPKPVGDYPENTPPEDMVYVAGTDNGVRYATIGSQRGYQSTISVLASVDAPKPEMAAPEDPTIYAVAVVASEETPGLGENIKMVEPEVSLWGALLGGGKANGHPAKRPAFQEQFSGKRLSELVVEKRPGRAGIVPITGATISSRATTEAARKAVERIIQRTRELYGSSAAAKP